MEFLQDVARTGGIAFLLIEQVAEGLIYLVPGADLFEYWAAASKGGRRSIPAQALKMFPVVSQSPAVPVDYLTALRAAGYRV